MPLLRRYISNTIHEELVPRSGYLSTGMWRMRNRRLGYELYEAAKSKMDSKVSMMVTFCWDFNLVQYFFCTKVKTEAVHRLPEQHMHDWCMFKFDKMCPSQYNSYKDNNCLKYMCVYMCVCVCVCVCARARACVDNMSSYKSIRKDNIKSRPIIISSFSTPHLQPHIT